MWREGVRPAGERRGAGWHRELPPGVEALGSGRFPSPELLETSPASEDKGNPHRSSGEAAGSCCREGHGGEVPRVPQPCVATLAVLCRFGPLQVGGGMESVWQCELAA